MESFCLQFVRFSYLTKMLTSYFVNFKKPVFFYAATAMVVTCIMTLVTRVGPENQKGIITGIFRSLGALARASGPIVASIGKSLIYQRFILYCPI